jgi:multisubunit Na+/H+ antiporter MnhB subunit
MLAYLRDALSAASIGCDAAIIGAVMLLGCIFALCYKTSWAAWLGLVAGALTVSMGLMCASSYGLSSNGRFDQLLTPQTSTLSLSVAAGITLLVLVFTGIVLWVGDPSSFPKYEATTSQRGAMFLLAVITITCMLNMVPFLSLPVAYWQLINGFAVLVSTALFLFVLVMLLREFTKRRRALKLVKGSTTQSRKSA